MTYSTTADEWQLFDQVRQFKEHDDLRGGYRPVVIGYWDRLGNTHCLDCPPETLGQDDCGFPFAITCDNSAAINDRCDTCSSSSLLQSAIEHFGKKTGRL